MNYLELSENQVREESKILVKQVEKEFQPEIIVFVAKGSYYIGDEISKYFKTPLIEIKAERKKNKLKNISLFFFKIIPSSIKKKLREIEVKSNIHKKESERNVEINEKDLKILLMYKNVLLVDDSIDTGNTIVQILKFLEKYNLNLKTLGLNIFTMSKELLETDYYTYQDTLLNGPWSKDSKYYAKFLEDYQNWKKK